VLLIYHLQLGERELVVNHKIILSEFIPKAGNEDFSNGNSQTINNTLFTPAPTDSFYFVNQSAESALNCIRGQGNPAFPFQPLVKNKKRLLIEVFHSHHSFQSLFLILFIWSHQKRLQQGTKHSSSLFVIYLGQSITDCPKRSRKLPLFLTPAITNISARFIDDLLLYNLLLQGKENDLNNRSYHNNFILIQAFQNFIVCETIFWYFIGEDDLDFEFVHGATSHLLDCIKGRFSPSSSFLSTITKLTLGQSLILNRCVYYKGG